MKKNEKKRKIKRWVWSINLLWRSPDMEMGINDLTRLRGRLGRDFLRDKRSHGFDREIRRVESFGECWNFKEHRIRREEVCSSGWWWWCHCHKHDYDCVRPLFLVWCLGCFWYLATAITDRPICDYMDWAKTRVWMRMEPIFLSSQFKILN